MMEKINKDQDQDQFYKFSDSDQDHQKDQVHLKDLDLFLKDQLIFPNPDVNQFTNFE